jgi:threonine synthase
MKNNKFYLECADCGKKYMDPRYLCVCECGGLLLYRYNKKSNVAKNMGSSVLRFHESLPIENTENLIDFGVHKTPLIKSKYIAKELGLENLYIKNESILPTGTFKDREAFINVSRLKELGFGGMVMVSTGHSGLAHARAWSIAGGEFHLFIPKNNREKWELMVKNQQAKEKLDFSNVTVHEINGTCLDGFGPAMAFATKHNLPLEFVFQNQLRTEGMKTLAFEIIEDLGKAPDWYIQTVGSGVGIFAFSKALEELSQTKTKFAGIQPKGCGPMVDAFNNNDEVKEKPIDTFAIGVGNPKLYLSYFFLKKIGTIFEYAFSGGKAEEKKEIPRYLELYKKEGIENPGFEAAVELSGLERLVQKKVISREETIVLCCSGELKDKPIGGKS